MNCIIFSRTNKNLAIETNTDFTKLFLGNTEDLAFFKEKLVTMNYSLGDETMYFRVK